MWLLSLTRSVSNERAHKQILSLKRFEMMHIYTTPVPMDILEIPAQWSYNSIALKCHGIHGHQQIF